MSPAGSLKEQEEAAVSSAGNAEDGVNPGAKANPYDERRINEKKAASDAENREDFDGIIDNNYDNPKKKNTNYNSDDYVSDTDIVNEQEQNQNPTLYNKTPSDEKSGSRMSLLGKRAKKLSPVSGIIGLILIAVVGVSGGTTTLASSLLVNIKEMLHSDRADGTRSNQIFSQAALAKKINYSAAGCGSVAIKCRIGTMNDSQIRSYERVGFKIDGQIIGPDGKPTGKNYTTPDADKPAATPAEKTNNRYIVKQITFPDGKIVTSGDGYYKYAQANVKMRAAALKAFNPRSAFFLNNRFTNMLDKTFSFSKANVLDGKTKAQIDESFNEKTGGGTTEENRTGAKPTKTSEAAKKTSANIKGEGLNAASMALTGVCQSYNLARAGVASVKIARMYELVSFALPFLQAADQIKDGGRIKPEVVDNLSSKLTSYENNEKLTTTEKYDGVDHFPGEKNPKYNLTATDSQGYKLALDDRSKLKNFAKKWLLGGDKASTVSTVDSTINQINTLGGISDPQTGKAVVRSVCKTINNPVTLVAGLAALVVSCASTIIGNEVTGPQSCISALAWVGAGIALSEVINRLADEMTKAALEEVKNLNLGSDLKGVDAGDAMAAGVGLMLGAQAVSSGLRPSTSVEESQEYITYTEETNNEYIAAEQYNARDTPFDINNQYSFLGSIISKIQPTSNSRTPIFSSLVNMTSVFSAALSTSSDTASALYSQPSFSPSERYDGADQDLADIGVIGDKFGSIATIMPTDDLKAAKDQMAQINSGTDSIDKILDYMTHDQKENEAAGGTADDSFGGDANNFSSLISNQPNPAKIREAKLAEEGKAGESVKSMGRSVDDDGKPLPSTQYALYLKYCTDGRLTDESQTTWSGEQGAGTYWGTSKKEIEKDSNRDQDWYSGKQCTDPIKSKMMSMFRQYTSYCVQTATMDGTNNCWNYDGLESTSASSSSTTECSSNGDTKSIYTCALKYDNYRYKWGGGHGDVANATQWIADFKKGSIPEWTPILDCSGLVRMAFVEAMGIEDQAYTAPDGYGSSKYWQKIPLEQAQQGDIVTSSGHVAIVESNDVAAKKFKIFDAETENGTKENNIRHSSQSYATGGIGNGTSSGTIAAYRAKKG